MSDRIRIAFGYSLAHHGHEIRVVCAVSTKISIHEKDTGDLIQEYYPDNYDQFRCSKLLDNCKLVLELNDEVTGPTELFCQYGNIRDEYDDMPEYTSRTFPDVKISNPSLCTCMVWTLSSNPEDLDVSILNGDVESQREKIRYVCGMLGIQIQKPIQWDGDCCS